MLPPRRHRLPLLSLAFVLALLPAAAAGQPLAADLDEVRRSKQVRAVPIDEPIVVDGMLDEPAWELAEPATDFYQQEPREGEPATRQTEVRFLYDSEALYVGAKLYDNAPHRAITNELKRDFAGRNGDLFGVILDTYLDRRSSYGFLTNPGGAQRETQSTDTGSSDPAWDGVWFVRTAVHEDSWTVEYKIPFKTLRFPDLPEQRWGLNIVRIIRRDNEVTTWSPVPRQFTHYHVGYAGLLLGIRGVEGGRNLRVTPFAVASTARGGAPGWQGDADGGIDLKWALTPSVVLDGTWRTDFAQVEADEQQINLTRFSLFFPEKRQFFLEHPAAFQIGLNEDPWGPASRVLIPFFTRRIGLDDDGRPIPVHAGLRLTGRAGATPVGILNMQTERARGRPGDNFTAVRAAREVGDEWTLGGFYFGRESAGTSLLTPAHNRLAGADFRYVPSRIFEVGGYAMRAETAEAAGDWAGTLSLRLRGRTHQATAGYIHVGDRFRHDLGFVRRPDIGLLFGEYARVFRPRATSRWVREHELEASLELTLDGRRERMLTRERSASYEMRFADGGELRASLDQTLEHLTGPFRIRQGVTIAPGVYRFTDVSLAYASDRSRRLSGSADLTTGTFWSGTRTSAGTSVRLRLNAHLAAGAGYERNQVTLPEGTILEDLARFRIDYSFTPRMFLNAFIQYNGASDSWFSNVRFNLVHRPLSDIYLVWNEGAGTSAGPGGRALILKYTHMIAF
jgi:hypothetical protein